MRGKQGGGGEVLEEGIMIIKQRERETCDGAIGHNSNSHCLFRCLTSLDFAGHTFSNIYTSLFIYLFSFLLGTLKYQNVKKVEPKKKSSQENNNEKQAKQKKKTAHNADHTKP